MAPATATASAAASATATRTGRTAAETASSEAPRTPRLAGLLTAVEADPALRSALAATGAARHELSAPGPLRPLVVAALARRLHAAPAPAPVLALVATTREADELVDQLGCLLPRHAVAGLPAWETLPHERLSPRADTVGTRMATFRRLAHPEADGTPQGRPWVVVAPVRSLLQPQVPGLGEVAPLDLRPGQEAPLEDLVARLVDLAYTRVEMVGRRGEFAVRGGLLDVFPPTAEHPVRIELWGDDVEEVREFAVADQRTTGPVEHLWAPACREVLLTDDVRERARALVAGRTAGSPPPGPGAVPDPLVDVLGRVADGVPAEGMEAFAPLLHDRLVLPTAELPAGTHVLVCDPERVRTRAADLVRTGEEFLAASWATAAEGGGAPVDLRGAALQPLLAVRDDARGRDLPWWSLSPFASDEELAQEEQGDTTVLAARPLPLWAGDLERAVADLRGWVDDGWRVVVTAVGHGTAERVVEQLREHDLGARLAERLDAEPEPAAATVLQATLPGGFSSPLLRLAVLTEEDLTGRRTTVRGTAGRLPARRRRSVDPLQLAAGDLVVHDSHGIGRFVSMTQRTVAGATREFLVLEFAPSKRGQPGDRLFVPSDALEQVTRYVGGDAPSLDRLGGGDWAKRKGRAKKAVKEIAGELVKLYSARQAQRGHAFGPDTPWQRELEDAFPYTETPDQLSTIADVKRDMERATPMDRVVCGDVGYGKTEIAVRAAFKAVADGKQVAVLVPTTLLASQHLQTFSERFAGFPVRVAGLSRFQSDAQAREVLAGMADGTVDVVVGTHRLFGSGVTFRDLGLVVVDEEQRFGVEHKEVLKALRASVDVLTMSATPIPRTLEMSLTGIREMSTILTPPEERHPVLTSVGPWSDAQVAAAVRRELLREGQVFVIHNRVDSIDRAAARIAELVPEARVATAHGQMSEDALEAVMLGFWERESDVLVCTTIVESGLDIANANTLVVERADLLGLSQLHQLRGRVGRSRERAYGYFFYPAEKPLTEEAHDRLATIAQNTDLGAGMAVAMKDLEIRGAGNLLGGEQSGHIAGVGFDLYVRMVGEAVAEQKGEDTRGPAEVKVDLPVDAHLPHDYVPGERLRLEAYRRLAAATDDAAVAEVAEELVDRYGPLPEPVENLLAVARFRNTCRTHGVTEVQRAGPHLRLAPVTLRESQVVRLQRTVKGAQWRAGPKHLMVPEPKDRPVGGRPLRDRALLDALARVLDDVVGFGLPPAAAAS